MDTNNDSRLTLKGYNFTLQIIENECDQMVLLQMLSRQRGLPDEHDTAYFQSTQYLRRQVQKYQYGARLASTKPGIEIEPLEKRLNGVPES